jgi:hypothetical protein
MVPQRNLPSPITKAHIQIETFNLSTIYTTISPISSQFYCPSLQQRFSHWQFWGHIEGVAHMPTALNMESVQEKGGNDDYDSNNSNLLLASTVISVILKEEDNWKKSTKNRGGKEEEENPYLTLFFDNDEDYLHNSGNQGLSRC